MEVQVIYEGVLEFGKNPESTTSRDWKSRLFVLKYDPKTKKSTLEYYKDTKKRWQKQVPKDVLSLWPTFSLSLAHMSSYKFPLKLVTSDRQTYCLAAPDVQTMNVWYNHIQSQLSLDNLLPDKKGYREYRVQVAETDSAKVIGATGECLLILSKGHLYLALASSKKVVGVWPYESLRRYYCAEGMFGFVAGRRSPRGEGEFKFISSQKEDIYHRLERAILRTKRGSDGSTSSSEEAKAGGVDSRPPAPLPGSQQQQQQVSPRQETPVQTSESDEDPFRNSPTFSPTLKAIMTDPPASEISPAYGRFGSNSSNTSGSQRVGGGGRRGQGSQWLHESVSVVPQPQESSKPTPEPQVPKRPALPPSSRNSQISMAPVAASEEDTYSHTVHPVPEQFQKKNIEHNIVGRTMYNALVHQRPKNTHHGRSSRPTSDADASLYDVAFPEGRKVIAPGGDYAVARHPDMPQYAPGTGGPPPHLPPRRVASATQMQPVRRWDSTDSGAGETQTQTQQHPPRPQQQKPQSQEAKKAPLPPPPSSSPPPSFSSSSSSGAVGGETLQQQNGGSDDGMTTNPMYGSQDHLLTEIAILNMNEQMREFELDSSVPEGYSGRVVHTHSGAAGVVFLAGGGGGGGSQELEMIDDGDQEFTSNPIYGELEEQLKRRVFEEETQAKLNLSRYVDREGAATSSGASVVGEGGERHGQSRDDGAQRRDTREEVEEDRSLLSECDQGIAEIRREGVDTTTMIQSGKEGERGVSQNRQEREASQLSTASSSSTVTDHTAAGATSTSEQSTESGGGGGVQRDAKGYSKVDKNKKTSNSVEVGGGGDNSTSESQEGSLPVDIPMAAVSNRLTNQSSIDSNGTPPPPLPERNYSFDESELNQPPLVNRGNGNGTQS